MRTFELAAEDSAIILHADGTHTVMLPDLPADDEANDGGMMAAMIVVFLRDAMLKMLAREMLEMELEALSS